MFTVEETDKMENPLTELLDLKKLSKLYQEGIAVNLLELQDASRTAELGVKEPLYRAEKMREVLSIVPKLMKSIDEIRDLVETNKQKTTEAVSTLTMYTQQPDLNEFRDHIETISKQMLANSIFMSQRVPNA